MFIRYYEQEQRSILRKIDNSIVVMRTILRIPADPNYGDSLRLIIKIRSRITTKFTSCVGQTKSVASPNLRIQVSKARDKARGQVLVEK